MPDRFRVYAILAALPLAWSQVSHAQDAQRDAAEPQDRSSLSIDPHDGNAPASKAVNKADIRALARAGKLNACVTDSVEISDSQPVIVLTNHCDHTVHVMLCTHAAGGQRVQVPMFLRSGTEARHRLPIDSSRKFNYLYNTCERPYCTPPEAEC